MVSFGSGGSAKSESKTRFPARFFGEAEEQFGAIPEYEPDYVGFDDFDRVEENVYGSQRSKIDDVYNQSLKLRNEELSQSGLLNSPSKYMEGGVRDTLDKTYIQSIQQAARDAALGRLDLERGEAERRTGFNEQSAMMILNRWLQQMGLAIEAGRKSKGSSSGGFQVGVMSSGGSSSGEG